MSLKKIRDPLKSKHNNEQLWLAIRLPNIALESLGISAHSQNMMVTYKGCVCAATNNMLHQGVTLGMPSSTAQLLHHNDEPPCRIYEREPDSENIFLARLCHKLYNYTPYIETYRTYRSESCEEIGIILELSTCLQLFKGLHAIIDLISNCLDNADIHYYYGQGHTQHMAWLLSYTQQPLSENHSRCHYFKQLEVLSLDYIYEYKKNIEALKKTGFLTFKDIMHHIEIESLASLRKRFHPQLLEYLCATLDIDTHLYQASLFQKPRRYYHPQLDFRESLQFDTPISNSEQLLQPMVILLEKLTTILVKKQMQTHCIRWYLYDIYQNQESVCVRFERLYHDKQLALELTRIQLDSRSLPFEVDTLELHCDNLQNIHVTNTLNSHTGVFNQKNTIGEQHAFATLTAKLNATLGDHAVYTLAPKDSHIPELSFQKQDLTCQLKDTTKNTLEDKPVIVKKEIHMTSNRPSWIFNIPINIGKRQNELFWQGKLELLQGPERIEGHWWVKPTARDYFIAKRDDHVRLWIFHDAYKEEWFVHGVFS